MHPKDIACVELVAMRILLAHYLGIFEVSLLPSLFQVGYVNQYLNNSR